MFFALWCSFIGFQSASLRLKSQPLLPRPPGRLSQGLRRTAIPRWHLHHLRVSASVGLQRCRFCVRMFAVRPTLLYFYVHGTHRALLPFIRGLRRAALVLLLLGSAIPQKPAATCHRLHCWRDCLPTTLRGTLCQVCRGSELDKFQSNSHCHITLRVPTRAVQMELVVSRAAAVQLVRSSQKQKGQTPAAFSGRGSYGIKRRNRHIKPWWCGVHLLAELTWIAYDE